MNSRSSQGALKGIPAKTPGGSSEEISSYTPEKIVEENLWRIPKEFSTVFQENFVS